jgi:integrase
MPSMKLTKSSVEACEYRARGQSLIYDAVLSGFGLRVGQKAKTYFAEKRVNGRTTRVTIGQHGHLTCEQARREAQRQLGLMAGGVNPNEEKRAANACSITLGEAFDAYLKARKLRPHTAYDYQRIAIVAFADWSARSLTWITKERILQRHRDLVSCNGPAYADQAMRVLRAVYNLQMAMNEGPGDAGSLLPGNPVKILSRSHSWHKLERRQTVIKPTEIKRWFRAVLDLCPEHASGTDRTIQDYLLLLLFTGLRRSEGAGLLWENVDWKARTLTVMETKNGTSHTLPIPNYLFGILQRRRLGVSGMYVFPGNGATGRLVEPRSQVARVEAASGVKFCLHDLRRTFISMADSLDISRFAIQRLVNHKGAGDVTAGYIVSDVERLRAAMQQVETAFLAKVDAAEPSEQVAS